MKKGIIFFLGVLTGIVLTIVLSFIVAGINNNHSGMTLYEQPGQVIEYSSFMVFQVLPDGSALAYENDTNNRKDLIVLLPPREGASYYDHQIVTRPNGTEVREIGSYRYTSGANTVNTVPVIDFVQK